MIRESTIKFLKSLKKNNNKPWFDAHRVDYEEAKQDFAGFIQKLIDGIGRFDPSIRGMQAKDGLFRINRDVRFSRDKSPYKTNFGASITRGGKKSGLAGYYFHLEPGESFVGGGIWQPMPPALKKLRQEIDYNFKEFSGILHSRKFRSVYGELYREDSISLSKPPQGFEQDNPAADFLKLKSWIALKSMSDKDLQAASLLKNSLHAADTLYPLLEFFNKALVD